MTTQVIPTSGLSNFTTDTVQLMPAGREIYKPPASPLCASCSALGSFLCQLILLTGKRDSAWAFRGPRSRLVMGKGSVAETFPKLPWETTVSHPGPLLKTADCWGLQGSPRRELGMELCSISSQDLGASTAPRSGTS